MPTGQLALFRTENHFYYFDPNTSEILTLSECVWEILPIVLCQNMSDPHEIRQILNGKYGDEEIRQTLESIKQAQLLGHLLPFSYAPKEVDRQFIEKQLSDGLLQLTLTLTESCNFRCKYCIYSGIYEYSRTHSSKSMSHEAAKRAIDYFTKNCKSVPLELKHNAENGAEGEVLPVIGFYGGEPLLKKDLFIYATEYAVSQARRLNKRISFTMTTNGSIMDDEILDCLATHDVFTIVALSRILWVSR